MSCRRYGSKATIALWVLIAVADLAILVATAGALTLFLVVAGLIALAGGAVATRQLLRPEYAKGKVRIGPAGAVTRRRA